jgi:hypothetical protein
MVRSWPLSYVLPIRWRDDTGLLELTRYLEWLSHRADVVVVDGSEPAVFARHREAWRNMARHVAPHSDLTFANGKVNGVWTGIREARFDHVILADDDVRYEEPGLWRMAGLLENADLVRPQNYFDPLPWHARWDSARSLINRTVGGDFPGTLGVRRAFFLSINGYDGDVLFENLELMRTVRAAGGRIADAPDLLVRRLPPTAAHFWSQRIRQAYDDLALPLRLGAFLAVAPGLALVPRGHRLETGLVAAASAVVLAEVGRRRSGGRRAWPASCALLAPLWVAERALCAWLAVGMRVARGGAPYAGTVIRRPATPMHELRRRAARRPPPAGLPGSRAG